MKYGLILTRSDIKGQIDAAVRAEAAGFESVWTPAVTCGALIMATAAGAANGLGECERSNYAKESPGWQVTTHQENGVHTAEFVTPTGAHYRSTAPPLPGVRPIEVSELEVRIGIAIAEQDAA